MKLIASGVANCAASVRSPSFSRCSSSHTTTMRPARISSSASSIVANGVAFATGCPWWSSWTGSYAGLQQSLDMLGQHVHLQVDPIPDGRAPPGWCARASPGISETSNPSSLQRADGQADAVHRDRALLAPDSASRRGSVVDPRARARRPPRAPRSPCRCHRRGPARRARRDGPSARSAQLEVDLRPGLQRRPARSGAASRPSPPPRTLRRERRSRSGTRR